MKATRESCQHEPFRSGVPLDFSMSLTADEFQRVQRGLIPEEMEDKWFIYFEAPFLFFHRSWSGQPVYRLKFVEQERRIR